MHVCLFDIDGTLLNTGGAGQAAMEAALATEFGVTAPTEGISTAGRTDRAITVDLLRFHALADDEATWSRLLAAYLLELPKQLSGRDGLVLPGVVQLMAELAARDDVVLGLLTGNFREGARIKLEHYELQQHFPFGGFGDHHHDRDDVARESLEEARRHRPEDIVLERVWVIGDTPADVRCGRAIGAKVIAVATGMYEIGVLESQEPDHLFADFSEPATFLELLVS